MKGCIFSVVIALIIVMIGFYFINKASVTAHQQYEKQTTAKEQKK